MAQNAGYVRRGGYARGNYVNQRTLPRPYPTTSPNSFDIGGLPPDIAIGNQKPNLEIPHVPQPGELGGEDNLIGRIVSGVAERMFLLPRNGGGFSLDALFDRMRYCEFSQLPLNIGTADVTVLPRATNCRVYLFLINTHAANRLFVNFGNTATPLNSTPLAPNLGFFEWLFTVPQQDIHLIANGANTTGNLIFAELSSKAGFQE